MTITPFDPTLRSEAAAPLTWNQMDTNLQGICDVANAAAVQLNGITGSTGSSLVGFLASGSGATTRTSLDKMRESVSVLDYGAKGDGVTDDTVAIQRAINAVAPGRLYIPSTSNFYKTTAPLVPKSGLHLIGSGYGAGNAAPIGSAIIKNAVSDVFANDVSTLQGCVFEGFTARSLAGGGHVFNLDAAGAVTGCEWKNLVLIQDNPGKSVLTALGQGGFFANHLHDFAFAYAASSSVPAINLTNPYLSHVNIENFYSYGSNTAAGTYSIWMEGTNNTVGYCCSIKNGTFESPGGGGINLLSMQMSEVVCCMSWDLSVVPINPMFNVGKSATNAGGSSVTFRGCRSTTGSATYPDLKFDGPTSNVSVDTSYFTYVDGTSTTSATFLTVKGSSLLNLANLRWTAEGTYLPSASINLGTYLYASGINNTIISKMDTSGNFTVIGNVNTGAVIQTGSNGSLNFKGNRDAADVGPDIAMNSSRARSAGNIGVFQNNGTNVAAVNWSGGVKPGALNAAGIAASSSIYSGTGVPSNTYGADGDFFLRSDTPGTANQRLYVKSAGAWAGIL